VSIIGGGVAHIDAVKDKRQNSLCYAV